MKLPASSSTVRRIALVLTIVAALPAWGAQASEPAPQTPLARTGAVLLADDFSAPELSKAWRIQHATFAIVDGALEGRQIKEHGAVASTRFVSADIIIEFRFQYDGAETRINAVVDDEDYKESHGGHICRVSISPTGLLLGDDKERWSHTVEELRKDPTKKAEVERLTAGRSSNVRTPIAANVWHKLRIEIVGDEMRAVLDDKQVGRLKSSGIAHPTKDEFHFTVSGKQVLFDDVKIWAAEPAAAK